MPKLWPYLTSRHGTASPRHGLPQGRGDNLEGADNLGAHWSARPQATDVAECCLSWSSIAAAVTAAERGECCIQSSPLSSERLRDRDEARAHDQFAEGVEAARVERGEIVDRVGEEAGDVGQLELAKHPPRGAYAGCRRWKAC